MLNTMSILVVIVVAGWLLGAINALITGILVVVIFAFYGWWEYLQLQKRRAYLMQKYGDPHIVERILAKEVWQGQTQFMLEDAIGPPVDRDVTVLKTKTKEIWKYGRLSRGRYSKRITVENGLVTGWAETSGQ